MVNIKDTDFKKLFTISIRQRDDNIADQYNRIFMMKIFILCSAICGTSWYTDRFNCIVPESMQTFEDFPKYVASTCWIQGVYIYRRLRTREDGVAYFGITTDADLDGMYNNELCKRFDRLTRKENVHCKPLEKTFYLQYQYMPFLMATLGLLFYVPRMIHKVANHDIINLNKEIGKDKADADSIFNAYFRRCSTVKPNRITAQHMMILFVRVAYIMTNVVTLLCLDKMLNGEFISFGNKWWEWTSHNNTMKFDYMGSRDNPKPANDLLPPFGYCELTSGAKDVRQTHVNYHKVVCELSQHILYQYVLALLWGLLIVGIVVSVLGFLFCFVKTLMGILGLRSLGEDKETTAIFKRLSHREIDYMEFLKTKNVSMYGEMRDRLRIHGGPPNGNVVNDVERLKPGEKNPLMESRFTDQPRAPYFDKLRK